MGFRFSRRIKIVPGITLNVSKSGVSTSVGTRGAHVTVGDDKTRTTVGLPGTGISYTEQRKGSLSGGWVWVVLALFATGAYFLR